MEEAAARGEYRLIYITEQKLMGEGCGRRMTWLDALKEHSLKGQAKRENLEMALRLAEAYNVNGGIPSEEKERRRM